MGRDSPIQVRPDKWRKGGLETVQANRDTMSTKSRDYTGVAVKAGMLKVPLAGIEAAATGFAPKLNLILLANPPRQPNGEVSFAGTPNPGQARRIPDSGNFRVGRGVTKRRGGDRKYGHAAGADALVGASVHPGFRSSRTRRLDDATVPCFTVRTKKYRTVMEVPKSDFRWRLQVKVLASM